MDTKALRQKILDLAIRGKLVPQDPNDEPASVLLDRIREQKKQMVKEGKLKAKDIKNDTIIFVGEDNLHYEKFVDGTVKCIEDEIPFELPDGWEWCRLETLSSEIGDGLHGTPEYTDSSDYYFINGNNLFDGKIVIKNDTKQVSASTYIRYKKPLSASTVFLSINGTIGNVAFYNNEQVILGKSACYVNLIEINKEYLKLVLESLYFQKYADDNVTGSTIKNLGLAAIRKFLVPIPCTNEVIVITQECGELLSYISSIEKDKEDVAQIIKFTKSQILDLAIRGKLVPQDPNDEPASVLLERIRAEKEELKKQGKIKRDKKESIIFRGDDNSYYRQTSDLVESISDWEFDDLPDNWALCCLGELCDYGNCNNVEADSIAGDAWILDLEDIEKDTGKVVRKIRKNERDFTSTKHSFYEGQVLYSKLRPYLNKVIIADEDGFCTSEILPLKFANVVLPQYALYYLMSPTFLRYANQCSYGVKMPRLGTADGRKAIFPLPPIEEQHQIANSISRCFIQMDSILSALL